MKPIPIGDLGAALFNGLAGIQNLKDKETAYIMDVDNWSYSKMKPEDKIRIYRIAFKGFAAALAGNAPNRLQIAAGMATQFVLESSFATAMTGKFNYGGIKEFNPRNPRKRCATSEYLKNPKTIELYKQRGDYIEQRTDAAGLTYHAVYDYFRDFASLEAYFYFKIALISGSPYKEKEVMSSPNANIYFERVFAAGYATAPNYDKALKHWLDYYNTFVWNNNSLYGLLKEAADFTVDKAIFAKPL